MQSGLFSLGFMGCIDNRTVVTIWYICLFLFGFLSQSLFSESDKVEDNFKHISRQLRDGDMSKLKGFGLGFNEDNVK
jgi:hypothetical protein